MQISYLQRHSAKRLNYPMNGRSERAALCTGRISICSLCAREKKDSNDEKPRRRGILVPQHDSPCETGWPRNSLEERLWSMLEQVELLQTDKLHREIHNWKRLAFIKYLSVPEIIPKAFSMNSPQSLSPHLLPAPALFHYSRSHHVLIAEPDV